MQQSLVFICRTSFFSAFRQPAITYDLPTAQSISLTPPVDVYGRAGCVVVLHHQQYEREASSSMDVKGVSTTSSMSVKSFFPPQAVFGHTVYLGAACLPLNVVENQTRARSSVPTKVGEWCAAFAALGGRGLYIGKYPPPRGGGINMA